MEEVLSTFYFITDRGIFQIIPSRDLHPNPKDFMGNLTRIVRAFKGYRIDYFKRSDKVLGRRKRDS